MSLEQRPQQQERVDDFLNTSSLENLVQAIRRRGSVRGSQKEYTAEEIEDQINLILEAKRNGDINSVQKGLDRVTGTDNLREAVDQLTDRRLETRELHPSLSRFKRFLSVKKEEIQKLHDDGLTYADIFYDRFYSEDFESNLKKADPEMLNELIKIYNDRAKQTENILLEQTKTNQALTERINLG